MMIGGFHLNSKHLIALACITVPLSLTTATADAYHMMKYDLGQVEVYGGMHWNPFTTLDLTLNSNNSTNTFTDGEKSEPYYGVRFGLGGKFSAEFRSSKNVSERPADVGALYPPATGMGDMNFYGRVTTKEYRLNYHPDKHWTVYVENDHVSGYARATGDVLNAPSSPFAGKELSLTSDSDRFMAGFIYGFSIGHGTAAWVGGGIGDRVQRLEMGVTHSINRHLNLDITYQYNAVNDIVKSDELGISGISVTNRGIYTGLSYWF